MKTRIITGAVIVAVFIPVLFFSGTPVFTIIISLLSVIGTYEMLKCVGQIRHFVVSVPTLIYSAVCTSLARTHFSMSYGLFIVITIIYLYYLMLMHVLSPDDVHTSEISIVFFTAFYITTGFSSIIKVRDIPSIGKYVYIYIFIGAWITDTFAYICGRLFGKHKLIPKVSPKKTVEGAVGGIVFCAVFFVIYSMLISKISTVTPKYLIIALFGAVISVVSQIGDLTMSAIKRDHGIKDYGNIFPGHGGVLDRFDSIIAVAPILYFLTGNPEIIDAFNSLV